MLHQNSSIALQSIVSTSIMYNDTRTKASKPFNFNLACKWLVIGICFVNPLSQIAPLAGMTTITKVSWDVANWCTTHYCPCKIAMPRATICFHIHASKFPQTQAIWLYLHCFHKSSIQIYDQCLEPLLWQVIQTSSSLG